VGATEPEPPLPYDRIEEDWELVIGAPDANTNAPQIINVIAPIGDLSEDYVVFEVNHCTQPDYFDGGMQLQMWSDDEYYSNHTPQPIRVLAEPNETIRYTLAMSIEQGHLKVRVLNGTSVTWGSFGSNNFVVSRPARRPNLSQYSTRVSTENSRIAFAAHRVDRFVLKQVRYYQNGTLVKTDEAAQQLHPPVE
jgi:hypothetical protein